jgi:23S rRNA (uracil1939-C5)-methyltransferase
VFFLQVNTNGGNMLKISSEVELTISDLNVDGSAVAKIGQNGACLTDIQLKDIPLADGSLPEEKQGERSQVVFVDHGLPGEVLSARIISEKKHVFFAQKLRCISPSPYFTEPFCPYFGSCGGCAFQNLSYTAQLAFKQRRVAQVLARIGSIRRKEPDILPSVALDGYRNKMEYAFGAAAHKLVLGFRGRGGQEVLDIERCPLQSLQSGAVLQAVRAWADKAQLGAWENGRGTLRYLVLREPEYLVNGSESQRSVELVCGSPLPDTEAMDALWGNLRELGVRSLLITQRLSGYNVARGERGIKSYGQRALFEKFGSLLLEFPVSGFAQTNTKAAAALYAQAKKFAGLNKGDTLWDIYSGAGALALYLGENCKSVWGVEQDRQAVKAAAANAARLQLKHCIFEAGEAGVLLKQKAGRPDIIVLDPPRAGLSAAVLTAVKKAAPRKIIYISCDAATLARDIKKFSEKRDNTGYQLADLMLFDLFPHTPHVEVLALLELKI